MAMARTVAYVAACTLAPWGCGDPAGGGGMKTLADPSKPIVVTCSLEAPREKMGDISGICRFAGGAGR
jgi:hypothetical protein